MSLTRRFGLLRGGFYALLTGAALLPTVSVAAEGAARLETFVPGDGAGYFALSISPAASARPAQPAGNDVLVLFDTSASQVNEFRQKGLEALEFFLSSLGANDRVQLTAVDL